MYTGKYPELYGLVGTGIDASAPDPRDRFNHFQQKNAKVLSLNFKMVKFFADFINMFPIRVKIRIQISIFAIL